eukprot:CAMPEP_0206482490 /NCGR_PEP_ID=MMETSP0324_2-20121206/38906_1 /ASSEMBLY_ACC=CAM_ASM_000836 /TAXON_ID=2866 /ORGANISM="Crypthecodinium cohnii, Strain Seligo" /LENGTH=149 /DNA_ID=CAMNT_0053960449 /DNA_START=294 /DNA_END=740 /DNA_ORIENTATION=+
MTNNVDGRQNINRAVNDETRVTHTNTNKHIELHHIDRDRSTLLEAEAGPLLLGCKLLRSLQGVLVHAEALVEDTGVDAHLVDIGRELLDAMQLRSGNGRGGAILLQHFLLFGSELSRCATGEEHVSGWDTGANAIEDGLSGVIVDVAVE